MVTDSESLLQLMPPALSFHQLYKQVLYPQLSFLHLLQSPCPACKISVHFLLLRRVVPKFSRTVRTWALRELLSIANIEPRPTSNGWKLSENRPLRGYISRSVCSSRAQPPSARRTIANSTRRPGRRFRFRYICYGFRIKIIHDEGLEDLSQWRGIALCDFGPTFDDTGDMPPRARAGGENRG